MSELRSLELRGNYLQKLPEELLHLKQHAPQLQTLDLRHNPWLKVRCFECSRNRSIQR